MKNDTRRLYEALVKVKKFSLRIGARYVTTNEQLALDELLGSPQGEVALTITELSQRFNASMPATSRLVKQLEEKGLVCRVSDTEDRRFTYVAATEGGRDAYQRNSTLLAEVLGNALSAFPAEQNRAFLDQFERLYTEIERELAKLEPADRD